ncbi:hypothetical protein V7S43_012888 [Phytophthora oleae]|uniref:Uncharacterized protein n=1 Tax=Phytophthora oleae TaxID=2107226 RepID=A0ABD3F5U6_9STRA
MRPSYKSRAKRFQLMSGSAVNANAHVGRLSNRIFWYWNPVPVHVKTFNVSTSGVCPTDTPVSVPDRDSRSFFGLRREVFPWSRAPGAPRPSALVLDGSLLAASALRVSGRR